MSDSVSDPAKGADRRTPAAGSDSPASSAPSTPAASVSADKLASLYAACADAAGPDSGGSAARVEAARIAREEAEELGGNPPDALVASLLEVLAHSAQATSAVYVGEAPGVVALALLAGMKAGATVTAITSDPHHAQAGKRAIAAAKYPGNACRFISTRPNEVLRKLAPGSYDLVVAESGALSEQTLATRGLELAGNGSVVILGSATAFPQLNPLRDADSTDANSSLDDVDYALPETARVHRLPLGDGVTILYADA